MTTTMTRILILDDEETVRRSLRAFLEDEGFELITAASGEEGLDILSKATVDAAIVDIRLPGMDGAAFIEKAHRDCPKMVFLICTGSVGFRPSERLRVIGVKDDQVFTKPIADLSVLVDAIERVLQKEQKK